MTWLKPTRSAQLIAMHAVRCSNNRLAHQSDFPSGLQWFDLFKQNILNIITTMQPSGLESCAALKVLPKSFLVRPWQPAILVDHPLCSTKARGRTLLHSAAKGGAIPAIRFLQKRGLDLTVKDNIGQGLREGKRRKGEKRRGEERTDHCWKRGLIRCRCEVQGSVWRIGFKPALDRTDKCTWKTYSPKAERFPNSA